jgi:hypothetical protein
MVAKRVWDGGPGINVRQFERLPDGRSAIDLVRDDSRGYDGFGMRGLWPLIRGNTAFLQTTELSSDYLAGDTGWVIIRRWGWPFICLQQTQHLRNRMWPDRSEKLGTLLGEGGFHFLIMPTFVNVTVYVVGVLVMVLGGGLLRQWMRGRTKRCGRCGYDLRGALEKGCSECGWNREESAA